MDSSSSAEVETRPLDPAPGPSGREPHEGPTTVPGPKAGAPRPPEDRPPATASDPLAAWLETPAARYLLQWERSQLAQLVTDRFGYYAVQLGLPQVAMLEANRMPTRVRVGTGHQPADVRVDRFDELPFESQSIDLVVVVHQLEGSAQPHRILREIDRVLRPEGHLIVTGFNPLSLWGLRHQLNQARLRPVIGPHGQMIGVPRLRDWCKLLGFEFGEGIYGLHAPMCRSQKGFERMRVLDRAGDRWWPILGAAYIVTAIKRVRGMRLIGPRWRAPVASPSPAVAASNRGIGRVVSRTPARSPRECPAEDGTDLRESAVILPLRRRPLPPATGRY